MRAPFLPGVILVGAGLLTQPVVATAQSDNPHTDRLQYWVTGGYGFSSVVDNRGFGVADNRSATVAVGSIQYRSLVVSTRWAQTGVGAHHAWDVGVLAGLGTTTRYPVTGSVAVGLGRAATDRGDAGLAVPLELQLGWRFTPSIGAGVYAFGSLAAPQGFMGVAFGLRVGRLR